MTKNTKSHTKDYLLEYKAKKDTPKWLALLIQKVIDTNAKISDDEKKILFQELLKENEIDVKQEAEKIKNWLKSRDRGFYGIEYSLRYGNKESKTRKYTHPTFNPDFFIKIKKDDIEYFLVVEIKADKDDCDDNKAKYKYAKEHFERLNEKLKEQGIKQEYIFHFLSPNGYTTFFEYLKDERILKGQSKFRCELENLLEENGDDE